MLCFLNCSVQSLLCLYGSITVLNSRESFYCIDSVHGDVLRSGVKWLLCVCVCVLDVRERGRILLPFVGGNNLSKFIISAILQQESAGLYPGEGCVCVCACVCPHVHLYMYCTMCLRLASMGRINPSPRFYGNAPMSAGWV